MSFIPRRPWINQAACAGHNTDLWVLPHDAKGKQHQRAYARQIAAAKAICITCAAIQQCGDEYLERTEKGDHDANAIAGGLTPWERVEVMRFRHRGATG